MDPKDLVKPELKRIRLPVQALRDGYIFARGSWWHIEEPIGAELVLRECTNAEVSRLLGHEGIFILKEETTLLGLPGTPIVKWLEVDHE